MEIIKSFPPNIDKIKSKFGEVVMTNTVFTYGNKLYNPTGNEVPQHLLVHEKVHEQQQEKIGIEEWWNKYLEDPEFRLENEVEAYAIQYQFVKKYTIEKYSSLFLDHISSDLSSAMYGGIINKYQAKTKIQKWKL